MSNFTNRVMLGQYKTSEASGVGSVGWNNGIQCVLPELKVYGRSMQNGTPAQNAPVTLLSLNGSIVCRGQNVEKSIALPTLRSAGSVQDVYNVTDGTITRNTVEIVVDGNKLGTGNGYVLNNGLTICTLRTGYLPLKERLSVVSTHFTTSDNTSVPGVIYQNVDWLNIIFYDGTLKNTTDVNAWFRAQYEAGTPLKIIHASREPTIETVEPIEFIQPSGHGQITEIGNTINSQIDVKYLTHS